LPENGELGALSAIATPGIAKATRIKEFNNLLFIMMCSFMVKLESGMK